MKYFTRELYDKMQSMGMFPVKTGDKEKWIKDWEKFYNSCHAKNEKFPLDATRVIPEIKDDILKGKKFTDREVSEKIYFQVKSMNDEWESACHKYELEYESIKDKLSVNMQELTRHTLHDSHVTSAYKTSEDCTTIELDDACGFRTLGRKLQLTFIGVKFTEVLGNIVYDQIIDSAVHLIEGSGFEFEMILRDSEFRIVADDVIMEFI